MRVVRQLDLLGDLLLSFGDRPCEVSPTNRELDRGVATSVLAVDRRGSFRFGDRSELSERDVVSVRGRDGDLPDLFDAAAIGLLPANGERKELLTLEDVGDRLSADCRLHHGIDVAGVETVAS